MRLSLSLLALCASAFAAPAASPSFPDTVGGAEAAESAALEGYAVLESMAAEADVSISKSEKKYVKNMIAQLSAVSQNTNLTKCERCIQELEIGKQIALENAHLVPNVFKKWCKQNDIEKHADCEANYGRLTVENSTMGADFGNMLQLMQPREIDGQYYCYYKRKQACDLPETLDYDISSWFPKKPAHVVTPKNSGETFNVLHISDHHLEIHYTEGAEANCTSNGMCCTPQSKNKHTMSSQEAAAKISRGETTSSDIWQSAKEYGMYTCDSPETLVNSSLQSAATSNALHKLNFEFAIFTGDLIDHEELSNTDYANSVKEEEMMFRDMKKWLGNIPVYSVMGNHDTFPYGQIAPKSSGFATKFAWNADLMADLWKDYNWIDAQTAQKVRSHDIGFSLETKRGLKIIALNSNTYYQKNLYSYWNMTSPDTFGTLRWLADELAESEAKNQRVWIMAHIPFNDYDALPIPAKILVKIVKRFSPSTIAGIFFGHTHQDQFSVLYETDAKNIEDALSFMWISPSVTPLDDHNPAWRYYEVDTQSFNVMNSVNYFTRLNETFSDNQEPQWAQLYDARSAYDPHGEWPRNAELNATFWAQINHRMHTSNETLQMYKKLSYRDSPAVPDCYNGECSTDWCLTSSFLYEDYKKCIGA